MIKQSLLIASIIIALSTVQTTAFAQDYSFAKDIVERTISIDGPIFTMKCPEFSKVETFEIDTSVPEFNKEYFENYQRILCNDMSPMEIMEDLNEQLEELVENSKKN